MKIELSNWTVEYIKEGETDKGRPYYEFTIASEGNTMFFRKFVDEKSRQYTERELNRAFGINDLSEVMNIVGQTVSIGINFMRPFVEERRPQYHNEGAAPAWNRRRSPRYRNPYNDE